MRQLFAINLLIACPFLCNFVVFIEVYAELFKFCIYIIYIYIYIYILYLTIYRLKGGLTASMISRLSIKHNSINYRLCNSYLKYKCNKIPRYKWIENDEKLSNNISRAKNTIFDYAMNNDFKFYLTLTTNKDYIDRFNLDKLISIINEKVKWLRRKFKLKFDYIVIPEKHENGAWHLHGLFSEDFKYDFYVNEHFYLSWASFDNVGFVNIQFVDNSQNCLKYITKYINKDLADRGKGHRLYFCSKGLKRSRKISDIIVHGMDLYNWSYKGEFGSSKDLTIDQYYNFIDNEIENYYYCDFT